MKICANIKCLKGWLPNKNGNCSFCGCKNYTYSEYVKKVKGKIIWYRQ